MTWMKQIRPGEKIGLKLTVTERKLLLEGLTCLPSEYERAIKSTPASEPVMLSLHDLDGLGGQVAADANHAADKKFQKKLDTIFQKIQHLLETHTDEEPPKTDKMADTAKIKDLSKYSLQIIEFVAKTLIGAEQLGVKSKPLGNFYLAPAQRDVLLSFPGISKATKKKLSQKDASFTVSEVAGMAMALAEDLLEREGQKQLAGLVVAQHLMERLEHGIFGPLKSKKVKAKKKKPTDTLFQFKVTLLESNPPIWRRIQVKDCTLDKLHEHIQTAMGWTNSHLHQFEIKSEQYGDPELLDDGFEDFECVDSTKTNLSDILPKTGKRFAFKYEYDFGDGWEHEVVFEGCPTVDPKTKYPICLEGARACPPEDVGGIGGFEEFLEIIANPNHEEHEGMIRWAGGWFDPEAFDVIEATKAMKKGLPDWRKEEMI